MLVIGERINGMFAEVRRAIEARDAETIQRIARMQQDAGANVLDVCVGTAAGDAGDSMEWLVSVIRRTTDLPLCIDTTRPEVMERGVRAAGPGTIINSAKADPAVLSMYLQMAQRFSARLIVLCIGAGGIPRDAAGRVELAALAVTAALEAGFSARNLFVDPVVMPVNVAQQQLPDILDTIRQVRLIADPAPQTVIGLSNVSQGTKQRSLLNRVFLALALEAGLDAAIMDATDRELMHTAAAAEVLLNRRLYCEGFLDASRHLR